MKKNILIILIIFFTFITTATATTTKTIMIFGDSLSTSYGLPSDVGWVSLLTQRIHSRFTDYQIINASISGETALGGRNRIDQVLKEHQPEIVILELGSNDGLRGASIKSIYENLEAIIKACKKNNALILLAGMQLPPNYGIAYTQKFQAIFPQLAENYQVKLIPFLLAGFGDKHDFFLTDGIHPNEAAQQIIAANVWEILQTMFQDKQVAATPDIE